MKRYFGDWTKPQYGEPHVERAAIVHDFSVKDEQVPPDADILFAWYSYEDYSGTAFVLFKKGDELFEVNGGHCSCNGLEGQWSPRPTTWKTLAMRRFGEVGEEPYGLDNDTRVTLLALIAEHVS